MKIPTFLYDIQQAISQIDSQCDVYLVGGAVRDLLLDQEVIDFDLLVNQNALDIVQKLAKNNYIEIISEHKSFSTAKFIWLANNNIIDIATTRQEYYEYIGALPTVNKYPVTIEQDLKRRDFTINSIAYNLGQKDYVDVFHGRQDLKDGIIKVLHDKSYLEDPTRILRAIRFATRFNYSISLQDIELITAVTENIEYHNIINNIRGRRFCLELQRILELPEWQQGIEQLINLQVWKLLFVNRPKLIERADRLNNLSWECKLFSMISTEPWDTILQTLNNLDIKSKVIKSLEQVYKYLQVRSAENITLKEFKELESLSSEFRELLFILNNDFQNIYQTLKQAVPKITPKELISQGVNPQDITIKLEELFSQNLN